MLPTTRNGQQERPEKAPTGARKRNQELLNELCVSLMHDIDRRCVKEVILRERQLFFGIWYDDMEQ